MLEGQVSVLSSHMKQEPRPQPKLQLQLEFESREWIQNVLRMSKLQLIFWKSGCGSEVLRAEKNSQLIAEQCALRRQLEAIQKHVEKPALPWGFTTNFRRQRRLNMSRKVPSHLDPLSVTFLLGTSLSLSHHYCLKRELLLPKLLLSLKSLRLTQLLVPLSDCYWINLCKHTCCHLRVELLSLRLLLHRLASLKSTQLRLTSLKLLAWRERHPDPDLCLASLSESVVACTSLSQTLKLSHQTHPF